jgi:NAD(P)-dependent dehydrogenase (short-subunit alcohol dehydrogenase family)
MQIEWSNCRARLLVGSEKTPLGRFGRVSDIAPLAVFLASNESAWITGEVIRAAGGIVVGT